MSRETSAPPGERYPELLELFEQHPFAYAGFRIGHLLKHGFTPSESSEVPFISTPLFPIAIVGYILFARFQRLGLHLVGAAPSLPSTDEHLMSVTDTSDYRTYTFHKVVTALRHSGDDVVVLCSPAASPTREEWENDGARTVTHRELHGTIDVLSLAQSVVKSVFETWLLSQAADIPSGFGKYTIYYNYILLEHIKRDSVEEVMAGDTVVHTYSPMPYLIDAADDDHLLVYQHGVQRPTAGLIMAAPFFAPLTYLVWGKPWVANFQGAVHPESRILPLGSPWYEYLADRKNEERKPTYDVIFISQSHGLSDGEEERYEQLFRETLKVCNNMNASLAVKLHPHEDAGWYERRGWADHIVSYDDIDDALLDARVAVTDSSSAFVESAILGTPVVVADLFGLSLSELGPAENVCFADGPVVAEPIRRALQDSKAFTAADATSLVSIGGSTNRIVEIARGVAATS